jgi:uncharacterized protein YndB with AHSA1/START domain
MKEVVTGGNGRSEANIGSMQKVEKRVLLRAPRSRVWSALTEVKKFCEWFGLEPAEGAFVPGARLHMVAGKELDGGDFDIFVEQVQPEHLFSWRWHPGSQDPTLDYSAEPTTLVVFTLADAPGGTTLTITESGFDQIPLERRAEAFTSNEQGWTEQTKLIQKYLEQFSGEKR